MHLSYFLWFFLSIYIVFLLLPFARAEEVPQGVLSIESDHTQFDPQQARAMYEGNVVITRSDLSIHAEHAVLTEASENRQGSIQLTGAPALFELKSAIHGTISGRAGAIDYHMATNIVKLRGKAWLRQSHREFSGDLIVYNMDTQHVSARSDTKSDADVSDQEKPNVLAFQ